jgi:hypothetical protein
MLTLFVVDIAPPKLSEMHIFLMFKLVHLEMVI